MYVVKKMVRLCDRRLPDDNYFIVVSICDVHGRYLCGTLSIFIIYVYMDVGDLDGI